MREKGKRRNALPFIFLPCPERTCGMNNNDGAAGASVVDEMNELDEDEELEKIEEDGGGDVDAVAGASVASRLRKRRPSALRMILDDREQRKIQRSRLLTRTPSSRRSTRKLSLFFPADSPSSATSTARPALSHVASV